MLELYQVVAEVDLVVKYLRNFVVDVMLVDTGVFACVASLFKLESIEAGMLIVRLTPTLLNISIILGKRHGSVLCFKYPCVPLVDLQ